MRWTPIILLLLVLQRVTLAVQGASLVCFGDGHVEVDCHDSHADPCGESEPKTPTPDTHDPCIDVSAAPVSLASRVIVQAWPPHVAWLVLLPTLTTAAPLSEAHTTPDLADESPPGFGARAFATTISPRT